MTMTKGAMNPKVDFYFGKAEKWEEETRELRKIVLECELTEELKWGVPCYTFQESNVVLIHVFKKYCAVLFCKGALLKDKKGILVQQTANVQAARQIRFTSLQEVVELESSVKAYVREAIEVQKAGLEVIYKETSEFAMPEEVREKLDATPKLKNAFDALTPGRQRGYILHFSAPKQSKTRVSRLEKCAARILNGEGFNER